MPRLRRAFGSKSMPKITWSTAAPAPARIVASVAAFAVRQRRVAVPLYDLHVAGRPTFWVAAVATVVCAVVLLMAVRHRGSYRVLPWVVGGLLLALVQQWGVAPRIEARENLALWHGVGTALLALQWVCAALCLWRFARAACAPEPDPVSPASAS